MNTFTSSLLSECNRYEKVVSFLQEVQFEFFYSIYNYNCNATTSMKLHLACWVVLLVGLCLVRCSQGLVVGVHLLANVFQGECIAWCKVFERCRLFSVALEHYSSEMCFSATEVHKEVLLKLVSSSQWVLPIQLVHISVLDDWCNMYRFSKIFWVSVYFAIFF